MRGHEVQTVRRPRIKAEGEGFYHVVSRIAGRRFLLDEKEQGVLLGMIRAAAAFSGVEVYTYAVMSNHFHLLVRVPRKREVDEKELLRRMEALYGTPRFLKVLEKWETWTKRHQESRVEAEKARLRARMYDLSQFCKTFKEAYTQDYNRRHDNTGTIWEGRFKSILLEGSWRTLMTVAGYIHLNPVRAKMVENAEEATNAGYGAACLGDTRAQAGLLSLVKRVYGAKEATWAQARNACAEVIEGAAEESIAGGVQGSISDFRSQISNSESQAPVGDAFSTEARLSEDVVVPRTLRELLRRRVAGFLHGGALGGDAFLARARKRLPKRARKRPATLFDRCPFLELNHAAGVRDVC